MDGKAQLDKDSVSITDRYAFALQLLQYEIQRLWTIFGLFLLAETVLLSGTAQVFDHAVLVYSGSAVGVLLLFPWWATFENTRKFYLLRLSQAKDFEPDVGAFLTEGQRLAAGHKISRTRSGSDDENIQISWVLRFMRPQRSGWFLMVLFAASFIGISALKACATG